MISNRTLIQTDTQSGVTSYEQQEVAAVSLDQLVEMAPTAAGMVPVWMSLSQSERLSDAVIERSMPGEESAFVNE